MELIHVKGRTEKSQKLSVNKGNETTTAVERNAVTERNAVQNLVYNKRFRNKPISPRNALPRSELKTAFEALPDKTAPLKDLQAQSRDAKLEGNAKNGNITRFAKYIQGISLLLLFIVVISAICVFAVVGNKVSVSGSWSAWSEWGSCSVSCDIGMKSRNRSCLNPDTNEVLNNCLEEANEYAICTHTACADGGWAEWGSWSSCTKTCGSGLYTRERNCSNPTPSLLGRYCAGSPLETSECNTDACPVNGSWSAWSEWGSCTVSCDIGMKSRNRSCLNPDTGEILNSCLEEPNEYAICTQTACADGGWTEWGSYGPCSDISGISGRGFHSRERDCSNPTPSLLGRYCVGSPLEISDCGIFG